MAHWQHSTPEFDNGLQNLAEAAVGCRDAFFRTAHEFRWEPAPSSGAAAASTSLPSPDPAIENPQGETGHRLVAEVIQAYLQIAGRHLGGLAALYSHAEVHLSPAVLVRATLESCARAVWVVGEDVSESSENRLARAYLEEYMSRQEVKENAGLMHAKNHRKYLAAQSGTAAMRREIRTRFPSSTTSELDHGRLAGQERPSPIAGVKWAYEFTQRVGGTISGRQGTGIYGGLSNMTHPTLYTARRGREMVQDPTTGHFHEQTRTDLAAVESEARVAFAAFYTALTHVTTYFGWPNDVLDELDQKFDASLPGFLI